MDRITLHTIPLTLIIGQNESLQMTVIINVCAFHFKSAWMLELNKPTIIMLINTQFVITVYNIHINIDCLLSRLKEGRNEELLGTRGQIESKR